MGVQLILPFSSSSFEVYLLGAFFILLEFFRFIRPFSSRVIRDHAMTGCIQVFRF